MGAEQSLDSFIERLRALGNSVQEDVARESAPLVMRAAQATAAAGTDPYGEPWRPRKDGTRAIPDAATAVDAVARGNLVVIRVHRGAAIQNYLSEANRRLVIPESSKPIPKGISDAIMKGAQKVFERSMG